MVNSLKGLAENIEESIVVQKFLGSFPHRFDSIVSAIEEMKYLDTLKMDELHGILIAYEMRKGIPVPKMQHSRTQNQKNGKDGIPAVMPPTLNPNWHNSYED